jgi:oxalate decarboxylase/phosphoglucose isomerase-like protein (cupin superfamily)
MSKPEQPSERFTKPKAFYDLWQEGEGVPVYKRFQVESLMDVELGEWRRFGCRGAFVNLADPHITTAAILEIPPGARTHPVKHIFEALVYGISGRGRTTISSPECPEVAVEWGAHGLFSPPLNTVYSHENLDREKPLRLLMVSNAPLVLSLFHNERFVFDNASVFDDRFHGQKDFFSTAGRHLGGRVWRTNFVPDVSQFKLIDWQRRGSGAKSFHLSMADNTMACHLSEFAVGTYKKAHRHGPGAHVVILAGQGYSLLWEEGKERIRVDWRPGSLFSPPEWWYHQHFNTGPEPARYLALRRGGSPEHPLRIGMSGSKSGNEEAGAEQIEYEDEDPEIRAMYERELAQRGIALRMPRFRG